MTDPEASYRDARDARVATAELHEARARTLSHARLAVFAAGAVLAYLAFGRDVIGGIWPGLAAAAFAALVVLHDGALRAAVRARRGASFYEVGLCRLDGRWVALPAGGPPAAGPEHPYGDDLDCLGKGSLFHRISTARTRAGEAVLAQWLLRPADPTTLRARHAVVAALRPRLALREELATLGDAVAGGGGDAREGIACGVDSEALVAWGETPAVLRAPALRAVAALLPLVSVALGVTWLLGGTSALPFAMSLAVQTGFAARLRGRVREALRALDPAARDLALLSDLLERIEAEAVDAERWSQLRGVLAEDGERASRRIARLRRRVDLLDARRNQLFAPFAALLLWSTQLAFAIDAWRVQNGPRLAAWIDVLGEVEALVSLAAYAYERPEDPFPELVDADGRAPDGEPAGLRFEAEALGHPLLPVDRCVRNDVELGRRVRVIVVSGSNMSGKSTLLRAVGTNAVLAQAGAPVCARRLVLTPLQVGASVQLRDSLLGGQSRFYAEIQRLRRVYALAEGFAGREAPPVLFLLDEILHGTNAQERRRGAEAVVHGLLERGAAGLVTTHDLALAEIVEREPAARNAHFADFVEDGALRFDYRLREGVAGQGNALALMRDVGLPV